MSLYEKIGPEKLRAVLVEFYERVFPDPMIGFLFHGKDKEQLVQREWEFTARFLGAKDIPYTGRPMAVAHRQSRILGGHFERRQKILRDVLEDLQVDEEVQSAWLEHGEKLRSVVTKDKGSDCNHETTLPGQPLKILK